MTGLGRAASAASLVVAALGWLVGNERWQWFGVASLCGVACVRLLLGTLPRASLAVHRPELEVTRGDAAALRVTVTWTRRGIWPASLQLRCADVTESNLPSCRAGESTSISVPLQTDRRGIVSIPVFELAYGDPFGLFRWLIARSEGVEVLVLPRVPALNMKIAHAAAAAEQTVALVGDEHFHALREYVRGDEPRRIHWKTSARLGQLVVKEFAASDHPEVVVVLDNSVDSYRAAGGGIDEPTFERAVEIAAGLLTALRGYGLAPRLRIASTTPGMPPRGGESADMRLLAQVDLRPRDAGIRSSPYTVVPATLLIVSPSDDFRSVHRMGTAWTRLDPREIEVDS